MAIKYTSLVLSIFIVILFVGCDKLGAHKNEINKIEIATTDCLRGCPVVGLIIDSTLAVQYYGGYKAKLQGYYRGKITTGFWDTLNIKLKQINFKQLDTSRGLPLDAQGAEAIFYWGSKKRHVFQSIEGNTDSIASVFTWIINSYHRVKLQKLNDSVVFETTFQYMQPPTLSRRPIVFPPPKRRLKNQ